MKGRKDAGMVERKFVQSILLVFFIALFTAGGTLAQPIDRYEISWWTVDGGGETLSRGGEYALAGTAGQPDADLLTGGGYKLAGGFWGGAAITVDYKVYLPLVLRNH
jgi:hypothetical protein